MNKSREAWAKVSPRTVATCSMPAIEFLIRDAQQDIEALYRQLDALGAKAVKAKRKAAPVKSMVAAPGPFKCQVPGASWVKTTAQMVDAPLYEDGHSSPELTRAYVEWFEKKNNLIPTTGASV